MQVWVAVGSEDRGDTRGWSSLPGARDASHTADSGLSSPTGGATAGAPRSAVWAGAVCMPGYMQGLEGGATPNSMQ